ncbi:MAG: biosynthetic-type acetolactate synthase large subunit [Synergistaceae bacterium]|nr:biosynthetic-type acetolactate synthase large subunit [Synergistaceae bacterium]
MNNTYMKINGSEILMQCLIEQGVDTIFGYPGGAILNVYDKLFDHKEIKHILTAHEQGASHAADGYARSTGKVGVCFATSGPGSTNLATGVATAYMDSAPVVFITCNVNSDLIGRDSFQEVDITGVTLPITKCSYIVSKVENLADTVREAFAIAKSGRPGPVLIDIQKNATAEECEYYPVTPEEFYMSTGSRIERLRKTHHPSVGYPEIDLNAIDELAELIDKSDKPLLICGGGVVRAKASQEFRTLAARIDSPVAITVMGGGAFPGDSDLKTGMIGMHGSQASNMACDACDLLISVGCRFSDRVTLNPAGFAKNAKIVQIDIDASEIDKNIKSDLHIIGDAKKILNLLLVKLKRDKKNDAWKNYVFSFKRETEYDDDPNHETLTPKQILSAAAEILPNDTIVTTDVGQHQMWAIQHFKFDYPGQLITSGGFGTMGFGLGAAIGAQVGNPDKTVLHVTGDGSFRMNCNELATEQFYKLPIITLLFNNSTLGMVRQWQHLIYNERYSQTTLNRGPDFAKLADAYGIHGRSVHDVESLRAVLTEAVNSRADGLGWVIDCKIDIDEMVRPMVGGNSFIVNFMLD